MFRVKDLHAQRIDVLGTAALVAIMAAIVLSVGALGIAVHEFTIVDHLRPKSRDSSFTTDVASVRHSVRQHVVVLLSASLATLAGIPILWLLRRRYLTSQSSLAQVKGLAHDILASMDQGIVTVDDQGAITSVNTAAIQILGVDFECVGELLASVGTEQLPLSTLTQQVVNRRAPVRDEDFSIQKNGQLRWIRADAHLLRDAAGQTLGCVLHLRDVTARTLLEERMRRMERFIGLGALAAGLHHEIKNPLTAVSIHIQLLEETLQEAGEAETVTDLLGVLKAEILRLNGVLENFRSFAHLQSLRIRSTDVLEVIERAIRLIRPEASKQKVDIALSHPPTQLPAVALDTDRFEQVILNLMINALEAMPSGGTLTLRADVINGTLLVDIEDSGTGIATDVQRQLFQPYFSTKGKGSGMGLAITEKIVSQHGGQIAFHTSPRGTVFRLTFPPQQEGDFT